MNTALMRDVYSNLCVSAKTHVLLDSLSEKEQSRFEDEIKNFDQVMLDTGMRLNHYESKHDRQKYITEIELDLIELEGFFTTIKGKYPKELISNIEEKIDMLKEILEEKKS